MHRYAKKTLYTKNYESVKKKRILKKSIYTYEKVYYTRVACTGTQKKLYTKNYEKYQKNC